MNKKKLFFIILGTLILPAVGFAQLQPYAPGAPHVGSLTAVVHSIEIIMGFVFGGIAVFCFLMAGILFLAAQGNPEKLQAARSAVYWGFAGVIVGIIAFSIIAIVSSFLAQTPVK